MPEPDGRDLVGQLARGTELVFYFQSDDADDVAKVRNIAEKGRLLGSRVFVDSGDFASIHLADNLADVVLVAPAAEAALSEDEVLRVLRPGGTALIGRRKLVKPLPEGTDPWSHPYHGPDNNPQSTDQLVRAPYLTQFLAGPLFSPMPQVTVAAGGRVFRAYGHIAHKTNQNAMLNKLQCASAYNGTILWERDLSEGFMIHRNTMIATPEVLFLADDKSCKLIDADSGQVKDEIVVPDGAADGPVWKWMALADGVLYALVGGREAKIATRRSETPGLGHWPWGMWDGHDYADPKTSFGFGRTLLAIDPGTKEILWTHKEEKYLDSRGVCMRGDRIYAYSPGSFLECIDAKTGDVVWKTSDEALLAAIGADGRAQLWKTGYSTTTYIKCNDDYIFFAGPQRSQMVIASAEDGKLLWHKKHGNYQLVLRDDGFYAAAPLIDASGPTVKMAYGTWEVLFELPKRRACTRATGSVDSVFFRAPGGTVRVDDATGAARHIAPMRPPCQDGVIISEGHLYWGPWMCGCQLSLYGHIALGPAGDFDFRPAVDESRLEVGAGGSSRDGLPIPLTVKPLEIEPGDWPTYGGDNARTAVTEITIPARVGKQWGFRLPADAFPTAPVVAGGLVFFGDRNGAVFALDAADGSVRWKTYTSGPVDFPPAVDAGRLFVGSGDGRVYALEATTGRPLWTFRAAPAERWISVYGKLISTWPVAGGVVVQDGTVYAAAGIAHYDGTYVYALDAATGKVKWHNDTSGATSKVVQSGVSLQGSLAVRDGRLRFLGGGVHETALYDLATGKCLNRPNDRAASTFHTSFYAYFPQYGKYMSLAHTFPDGRSLVYDASYEGSRHSNLALFGPLPPGAKEPRKPESRWMGHRRPGGPKRAVLWQQAGRRFNSFIVAPNVLLTAGHTVGKAGGKHFLAAVKIQDGSPLWEQPLPGPVVKGGTAIDHQGRILVSLENGQVLCFAAPE